MVPKRSASGRILEGTRVVDLTRTAAGPLCAQMLGDLGADVIKVEEPGVGDETRHWYPAWRGESTYFLAFNRNKRSITVDLANPGSRAITEKLLGTADVVVESFRTGVADRFGIGYRDVAATNPRVVYCSISGFGRTGPKADHAAYEAVVQAFGGLMSVTGEPDGPPVRSGFSLLDHTAGLLAFGGILAALLARERTGRGQYLETSLLDASLSAMSYHALQYWATGEEPGRHGSAHPAFAPYEAIPTSDGHIQVAVGNQRLWHRFCEALDLPDLEADPRFATNDDRIRSRGALVELLTGHFAGRGAVDWEVVLTAAGIPCSVVNSVSRVLDHPQVIERNVRSDGAHPRIAGFRSIDMPIHFGSAPTGAALPPPLLGEHTTEVLEELGFEPLDIERLHANHVI